MTTPVAFVPDAIPAELRESPQWVAWWSVVGEGKTVRLPNGTDTAVLAARTKPHKLPINPHSGGLAATSRAKTWGTFEQATVAVQRFGVTGIGFVFTSADAFAGMDLDNCRDPATGEINPAAAAIIVELNSYTEVSPSGTGVKIFCKLSHAPGPRHRTQYDGGEIEIYSGGRYFTVTGIHVAGTSNSVEYRQDELQRVYDRLFAEVAKTTSATIVATSVPEPANPVPASPITPVTDAITAALNANRSTADIVERAHRARNGAKFAALFDHGDTGLYGNDESRADLALCNMLAFWCRDDVSRMDSLFRLSALMRPKWDEKHSGDGRTYGQITIECAISSAHEIYRPSDRLEVSLAPNEAPPSDGGNLGSSVAADHGDKPPTDRYAIKNGGIVRSKPTKEGPVDVGLTNFIARITDDIAEDDGVETKRHLKLEANVAGRTESFTIPASDFHTMEWPIEYLGPEAIVYPNQKEYARTAIQVLSGKIQTTRTYTHTGWRKVGDLWLYLHGAGAIGKSGPVEAINVHLSGALSHFDLALPANDVELKTAISATLHLIDAAPDHIVFPLLAAIFRAAIKSADFGIWLAGPTGVFKSELAALAQQHYGPAMDSRHLPASFASTGNALETVAFHAKDALLVVDDFAPNGSIQDVARYHSAAERLLRAAGNGQGRGRLTSDARLREAKCPRGLVLVTGEDVPRGQSIRGRILIVEVGPGDVKTAILTENQRDAAAGLYAKAMGAFIRHLATDYERRLAEFQAAVLEARSRATTAHSRTPGIVADLQCGMECFLDFAVLTGAITDGERCELADRCWIALNQAARAQRAPQEASEPARHLIRLLSSALAAGRAHVAFMNGGCPIENEGAWGWRLESVGQVEKRVAMGTRIGWTDGTELYLEPTAAYAVAQELARSTGEPLAISEIALNKRLKEKGLLATVDTNRETLTVRRTIQGVHRKVLHLRVGALLGDVGFPGAHVGSLSGSSSAPDNGLSNGEKQLQGNVGFVGRNTGEESPGEFGEGKEGAKAGIEVIEL